MSPAEQPADEHQVGITNAQEKNPDEVIADLTKRMNAHFAAGVQKYFIHMPRL